MPDAPRYAVRANVIELLTNRASAHFNLDASDKAAIQTIRSRTKALAEGDEIVRQGDKPDVAVLVLGGMLARYHTLPSGDRQYLSFHIAGDLPDIQSVFLRVMDHSVCAMDHADVATVPHDQLQRLFRQRPNVAFAFWRLTLVDAAIFRQAITNNAARSQVPRLAHFFCEQYLRAREAKLVQRSSCMLPLSQRQLGQTLGMSLVSVNRALQQLRSANLLEFRSGALDIRDWRGLCELADFDATYLHVA
jgi:CRP-like cAMP-binding protein